MNFFLLVSLFAFITTSVHGDIISDRGTNAANVASAGLDACRSNSSKNNKVPYLTSNSYMSASVSIIGGVLKYYHDKKNITDPTTILWQEMLSYAQYPNNKTYANVMLECIQQTPWKIALKLKNRLYGPDNTLMTQIKANQYDNATFMATKDVIIFRIFQLMTVNAFCLGVENGPNFDITQDWEHQRIYSIYSDIVNNTIAIRIKQETEYLNAAAPSIISSCVTSNETGQFHLYAQCIYNQLSSQYQWDKFGVVISSHDCDHLGEKGSYNGGFGSCPYSVWKSSSTNADVWIIRYWTGPYSNTRTSDYQTCMKQYQNSDPVRWAKNLNCGQSFEVLADTWWCGKNFQTYGYDSYYYVSGAQINGDVSSGVFPASTRPTTVAYDLGFWERPINIQLLPSSN